MCVCVCVCERSSELEGFLEAGAYGISETLVEELVEDNKMCLNNYVTAMMWLCCC